MKNPVQILLLSLSLTVLFSCEKCHETIVNEPQVHGPGDIVGTWVHPVAMDTLWRYERTGALVENDYGFSCKTGQVFVERKNAGFCGTPPITYGDFDGTWSQNDSIINISVAYWNGMATYQWKIISVDAAYLTVYKVMEEY